MDVTKQPKSSARKQIFSNSGSEKSVKKSKSKKKKSSKRRQDKEVEKYSTSPDFDISDQDGTESTNLRQAAPPHACQSTETPPSKTLDSCQSKAKTTSIFTHLHSSSQPNTAKITAPPSVLLLQPHAIGFGENKVVPVKVVPEKVVPAKVMPKSTATVPTPKPKSISSQTSVKSSRSDLSVNVKDSASRQSVASSKSYSKNSLANLPELNKEALRWEYACAESDDEEERIKQYKLNRRKRYLAAANKKYSDWLKTLHENISGGNTARQDTNRSMPNSGSHSNGYSIIPPTNEGLVAGLGPAMSIRNPSSQVLLTS